MANAKTRRRRKPESEESLASAVGTALGAARGKPPAAVDELADRERGSPGPIERPARGMSRRIRRRGRSR